MKMKTTEVFYMGDNYIILNKQKIKNALIIALDAIVIACGFIWVCLFEHFLGFGVYDFGEQMFTLIMDIIMPLFVMTATYHLMKKLLKGEKPAFVVNLIETLFICGNYCYFFLSSVSGAVMGITDPTTIIILSVVLHLIFGALLFILQTLVLNKLVARAADKKQ